MNTPSKVEAERQLLTKAQAKGKGATFAAYMRLSGPGWLQSAITLGGGSLASSLYLGVLAGFALLWLQPFAMILGIIMLSAIGYVTLTTGERPFRAINQHVNPVLGWSWALATLMANMVWCLPQFSLANSVLQQNLLPEVVGAESALGGVYGKIVITAAILVITVLITWSYGSGHWGLKLYEILLKLMVATIVICFFLVVFAMARAGGLKWGAILAGFIPDPRRLFEPAAGFQPCLDQVEGQYREFWKQTIVDEQLNRMAAAAATAVGINMTFLFPYSMIRKGWTREFRGLQVFDLATGMFIPFVLATSCVVIVSATQFHAQAIPGLVKKFDANEGASQPTPVELKGYHGNMRKRLKAEMDGAAFEDLASGETEFQKVADSLGPQIMNEMTDEKKADLKRQLGDAAVNARVRQLPEADRMLGAMLVERDANRLAKSLAPLTESRVADLLFGIGVVGMTLSTITLLMLISGFVICEFLNLPATGWPFRISCLAASVGALGPFIWSRAGFALAIPTSVFCLMLLPIAYLTFFLLMNQRSFLGEQMPRGGRRVAWNVLMAIAAGVATVASLYMMWRKVRQWEPIAVGALLIAIGALLGLALLIQVYRWIRPRGPASEAAPPAEVDG
jgi:Mn2+/Fe2+ NRAMP family transporter